MNSNLKINETDLIDLAKKTREHSHSPYSGYKVGAALRTKSGNIYRGCNVENSSIGATVCAERSAISTAVSTEGKIEIDSLVVITDASPPWMPCGICRQVLSEFGEDFPIIAQNLKGETIQIQFSEIYPSGFSKKEMNR